MTVRAHSNGEGEAEGEGTFIELVSIDHSMRDAFPIER